MVDYTKIISIDPGNSGGIAIWTNRSIHVTPMPIITTQKPGKRKADKPKNINTTDVEAIQRMLREQMEGHWVLLIIEKVTSRPSDLDSPGKIFQIQKMLANVEALMTVIKLSGVDYVEVMPRVWQKALNLTKDKNAYKAFAQEKYPMLKVTLKTADAICILLFCRLKLKTDPKWIESRVNRKENNLI